MVESTIVDVEYQVDIPPVNLLNYTRINYWRIEMTEQSVDKKTQVEKALKLALSVLNEVRSETFRLLRNGQTLYAEEKVWNAITAIREALASEANEQQAPGAEPHEQQELASASVEPVAYIHRQGSHWEVSERFLCDDEKARGWTEEPLYTSPPYEATPLASQRSVKPWAGLTDDEIQKEFHPLHATGLQFARSIEAKLKEKNT